MATKKKLIHFKKGENYDIQKANGNILDSSICFIQDRRTIVTHGTEYKTVNWGKITPPPLEDGVYVLTADRSLIHYSMADKTALGVVVVYGEHKFMIAKEDAPEEVRSSAGIDLPALTAYDTYKGVNGGYLSKNFLSWGGALSDFDGKHNTDIILNYFSINVLNNFNQEQQIFKDWYIPALGQLGIVTLLEDKLAPAIIRTGKENMIGHYTSSTRYSDTTSFWNAYIHDICLRKEDLYYITITYNWGYNYDDLKTRFFRDFKINDYISIDNKKADIISFVVDGKNYQAFKGMSWKELCVSDFDNDFSTNSLSNNDTVFVGYGTGISINGVVNNDIIIEGHNYSVRNPYV